MKKKNKIIGKIFILCPLTFIAVLIIWNILYEPLPKILIGENAITAKQLIVYSDNYVKTYAKNKDMYLSNIIMRVNGKHEGKISITYTHKKNGGYNRYNVEINNIEHIILTMHQIDKSVPASIYYINFANWIIDSDEAVNLARRALKNEGIEVDNNDDIYIVGRRSGQKEYWLILFTKKPGIIIDAYTGEATRRYLLDGLK